MLYLLLGSDDFTKKQYVHNLALEKKADLVVFEAGEEVSTQKMLETDLFSKPKVFVLPALLGVLEEQTLEKLIKSPNVIAINTESLDKRKTENKKLLERKDVVIQNFVLPHGRELDGWILKHFKDLGGHISADGADELAKRLGRDEAKETKAGGKVIAVEEVYSLWQADSEVKKLVAFCGDKVCTAEDVKSLVGLDIEIDPFRITNALADGKTEEAWEYLEGFFKNQGSSDRKALCINLNALLAEQFRNVYMVQGFLQERTSEEEILQQTGWKSGRLFVMKKIAGKFKPEKVLETLKKLSALDIELKTGSMPERVMLDLILAQL